MPNGGFVCCLYCFFNNSSEKKCKIFGIETSPHIICRMFSRSLNDVGIPELENLEAGIIYSIANSLGEDFSPKPLYKVVRVDEGALQ
jgi:hypothetical protein